MGRKIRDLHGPEYQQARAVVHEVDRLRIAENVTQGSLGKASGYSQTGLSQWFSFQMPNFSLVT